MNTCIHNISTQVLKTIENNIYIFFSYLFSLSVASVSVCVLWHCGSLSSWRGVLIQGDYEEGRLLRWHTGRGRQFFTARRGSGELVCRVERFIKCCASISTHTPLQPASSQNFSQCWGGHANRLVLWHLQASQRRANRKSSRKREFWSGHTHSGEKKAVTEKLRRDSFSRLPPWAELVRSTSCHLS